MAHVIADSISMHYGPFLEKMLAPWCRYSRKGDRIGALPNLEGQNGQDSPMVLEYVKRCIDQKQFWDVVLVNCGLWDIRNRQGTLQTEVAAYAANLNALFSILPQICDRVIWVRTTPVDDVRHNAMKHDYHRFDADVRRYNEVADEVAHGHGTSIIDLYGFCRALGLADLFLDHIHFTDGTRRLQAAFITGQVVALLGLTSHGEVNAGHQ